MKSFETPQFTWIYLENPQEDDLKTIQDIFNLHPVFVDELRLPTYRPRVDEYHHYLFMVLHFPVFNRKTRATEVGEIDILVNHKYLLTSCNKHQYPLFHYMETLRRQQKNSYHKMPANSYELLLHVIDILMNSCFPKLDHIADNLNTIEEEIFAGKEQRMVREISVVKRDILNFRRTIKPQRSILESLRTKKMFENNLDLKTRLNDTIGTNIRVWNVLENHKETIDSLEATNDSLFSYQLNEIMKTLTAISAVLFSATLAVSLLQASNIPLMKEFWVLTSIIGILILSAFLFIKRKRWL